MSDRNIEFTTCGHKLDKLYLHSKCHENSPTWVWVSGNVLTIECAECDKEIASFLLKEIEHGQAKS